MGSVFTEKNDVAATTHAAESLGNQILLDKIDRLRELNVGAKVSLPQLVVVGDQSSGKSSVLESLTGFSFPRAAGLCTRYATQITCRREPQRSVIISIIPRPNADDVTKTRLQKFRRYVDEISGEDLVDVFEDANRAMRIRPAGAAETWSPSQSDDDLVTFSEDILKIEINGPDQPALTVIDVPGIFRTATKGLTTESDISLVTSMVKSYMKDSRTIILAVIPCNVDIATQEILKLAKDADPSGFRTMGVLTKPDLAPEKAMQQNILDLILGKRQDLKLGYCVVKNRGADDENSSLQKRNADERAFFRQEPWTAIASSNRVGVAALTVRLRELLMDISRKEFPKVKADILKSLADCRKRFETMGISRSDEQSQRAYLGKVAANFERMVGYALNAYYTEDPIFSSDPEMRLITRVIELNEVFNEVFSHRGHTRYFDRGDDSREENTPEELPKLAFELPELPDELKDVVTPGRFLCPKPSRDSIMDHIEDTFKKSRGPELGTFGGSLLGTTFKEQSERWESLVLSHVSDVILIVHRFITQLLDHVFPDTHVRSELWDNVLLERLQASYQRAIAHARFLLDIEREGKPTTYNDGFSAQLQKRQGKRLKRSLGALAVDQVGGNKAISLAVLGNVSLNKSNPEHVREYLHDILKSYYNVSVKRFVDVVCQQVIDHYLLSGKDSPLRVFSTDLVFDLSADSLEMIAGEDQVTKQERVRLGREIESLQEAIKVLRG